MTQPSVPGYEIDALLGEGASAKVYRGRHRLTGKVVALKVARARHPKLRLALEAEVLAMARLNHPNVLTLHDTGQWDIPDGCVIWLATDLAEGGSFEHWSPRRWRDVQPVFEGLLSGLAHAHALGVVHRDLKPANLLRGRWDGVQAGVRIADFGLTALRGRPDSLRRSGSPSYMAPEQVRPELGPIGPWTDIYALGCTLWEWMCGGPPFEGRVEDVLDAQVTQPLPPFRPLFSAPDGLEALIRRMLAKPPRDRPLSVGVLKHAIHARPVEVHAAMAANPSNRPQEQAVGIGLALLPLRRPHIVGRFEERALLTRALQQVIDTHHPQIRLLRGPSGIGRRRVIHWLAEAANEAGIAEVVWSPTDLSFVRWLAEQRPVIVVFDGLTDATSAMLESCAFAQLPLLGLAPCPPYADLSELQTLPGMEELRVGPLEDHAIREMLHVGLGLTERLALRMSPRCGGHPGRAREAALQLKTYRRLMPTPEGFDASSSIPIAAVIEPDDVVQALVENHSAPQALRAAAWCPEGCKATTWEALAPALEVASGARLAPWLEGGRVDWSSQGTIRIRSSALIHALRALSSPSERRAMAGLADQLPDDPDLLLLKVRLHLAAGDVAAARGMVLRVGFARRIDHENTLRAVVELLRPYMAAATPEEHVRWLMLDVRTTTNLSSHQAALPLARQLARALPGIEQPEVATHATLLTAEVFVLSQGHEEAVPILKGLPESAKTLWLRGLLRSAQGLEDEAREVLTRAAALASTPHDKARVANSLGATLGRLGRYGEATTCFDIAIRNVERPTVRAIPLTNKAQALLLDGQTRRAMSCAQQACAVGAERGVFYASMPTLLLAISAALLDADELDEVVAQALHCLERWGLTDGRLFLPLLQQASPTRPESRMFLRAVRKHLGERHGHD